MESSKVQSKCKVLLKMEILQTREKKNVVEKNVLCI